MIGAPLVLSVAGFDPSGRTGLLADCWAIRASGGVSLGVVTALTAQGDLFHCAPVGVKTIGFQLRAALGSGAVRAVKLGMVPDRQSLRKIVSWLGPAAHAIVIDPVVRTSRGESLSELRAEDYLQLGKSLGGRRGLVLTPNRAELAWLGASPAEILELGFTAVIVKGSDSGVDEVFFRNGHWLLHGTRLPRSALHHRGTGCRFSAGLATRLARGEDLRRAVQGAKRLVRKFLSCPIVR